jgi:hypothetical protein
MALENQLKVAADEVAQCFLLEEDPELRQETDQEHEEPVEESSDQKTLKNVCGRVVAVLDMHARGESRSGASLLPISLTTLCSDA